MALLVGTPKCLLGLDGVFSPPLSQLIEPRWRCRSSLRILIAEPEILEEPLSASFGEILSNGLAKPIEPRWLCRSELRFFLAFLSEMCQERLPLFSDLASEYDDPLPFHDLIQS